MTKPKPDTIILLLLIAGCFLFMQWYAKNEQEHCYKAEKKHHTGARCADITKPISSIK